MLAMFILLESSNALIVIPVGEAEFMSVTHMSTSCIGQAHFLNLRDEGVG